jgi:hypothetical protein
LIDRGLAKRIMFHTVPALSLVPDALAPPNGCCPTTEAVDLSLMQRELPAAVSYDCRKTGEGSGLAGRR